MTDDRLNDLVSAAAKAHDADFGTPAIYAALKAATEDRIHLNEDRPNESAPAPPDRPYISFRSKEITRIPRRFLAAVAAIAFIATAAAGVALSGDDDAPVELEKATTTTMSDDALMDRIVAAYRSAYANSIEYTHLSYTRTVSITDSWRDESLGIDRYRSTGLGAGSLNGKPAHDAGAMSVDGGNPVGHREIDHCFSEYADDPTAQPWVRANRADVMRENLDLGILVIEGPEVLDGRDSIRLSYGSTEPGEGSLWLDATTLLPFREMGWVGSAEEFIMTYEFLTRSEENLQLLVPKVPAGYTKVDKIRPSDAGIDEGCEFGS